MTSILAISCFLFIYFILFIHYIISHILLLYVHSAHVKCQILKIKLSILQIVLQEATSRNRDKGKLYVSAYTY